MGAQLPTTSILAAMYSLILVVHAQGQGDQIPGEVIYIIKY